MMPDPARAAAGTRGARGMRREGSHQSSARLTRMAMTKEIERSSPRGNRDTGPQKGRQEWIDPRANKAKAKKTNITDPLIKNDERAYKQEQQQGFQPQGDESNHHLPRGQGLNVQGAVPPKSISPPLKGEINVVSTEGQQQKAEQTSAGSLPEEAGERFLYHRLE